MNGHSNSVLSIRECVLIKSRWHNSTCLKVGCLLRTPKYLFFYKRGVNFGWGHCSGTVQYIHILHPESFRSNAQNANAFALRNRPRVDRNNEFACVYLRLCACVCIHLRVQFTIDCVRIRACIHAYVRI